MLPRVPPGSLLSQCKIFYDGEIRGCGDQLNIHSDIASTYVCVRVGGRGEFKFKAQPDSMSRGPLLQLNPIRTEHTPDGSHHEKICQVRVSLTSRQTFLLQGMVSKGTFACPSTSTGVTTPTQMQWTKSLYLRNNKKAEKIFAKHISR